jgi:hypothetical protein
MAYAYGQTKTPYQQRQEARRKALARAAELAALEIQLQAKLKAAQKELRTLPARTYYPTKEALEWRDRPNKKELPPPMYGGHAGLEAAAREAASWDVTHRRGTWQQNEGQEAA